MSINMMLNLINNVSRQMIGAPLYNKQAKCFYVVDPLSFIIHIPNLSQCIDALNLITVYKQGESIGCRVGSLPPKSIGLALGFQQGDIITAINSIPSTTTDSRFEIYQTIVGICKLGDTIHVAMTRNNKII